MAETGVLYRHVPGAEGVGFTVNKSLLYLATEPATLLGFQLREDLVLFDDSPGDLPTEGVCSFNAGHVVLNFGNMVAKLRFGATGPDAGSLTALSVFQVESCLAGAGVSPEAGYRAQNALRGRGENGFRNVVPSPARGLCPPACPCASLRLPKQVSAHHNRVLVVRHGRLLLAEFPMPVATLGVSAPPACRAHESILMEGLPDGAWLELTVTPGLVLLVDPSRRCGHYIDLGRPLSRFSLFRKIALPLFEDSVVSGSYQFSRTVTLVAPGGLNSLTVSEGANVNILTRFAEPMAMMPFRSNQGTLCRPRANAPEVFRIEVEGFGDMVPAGRLMLGSKRALSLHENFLVCHEYVLGTESFRLAGFSFALQLGSSGIAGPGRLSLQQASPPQDGRLCVVIDGQWAMDVDLEARKVSGLRSWLPAGWPQSGTDRLPPGGMMTTVRQELAVAGPSGVLLYGLQAAGEQLAIDQQPRTAWRSASRPAGIFAPLEPDTLAVATGGEVHFVRATADGPVLRSMSFDDKVVAVFGHRSTRESLAVLTRSSVQIFHNWESAYDIPLGGRQCLAVTQLDDGSLVLRCSDGFFDLLNFDALMFAERHVQWRDQPGPLPGTGTPEQVWVCPWFSLSWVARHPGGRFVFHTANRQPDVYEPWAFLPTRRSFALDLSSWPGAGEDAPAGAVFLQHGDRRFCVILFGQRMALIPEEDLIRLFIDPTDPSILGQPLQCSIVNVGLPLSSGDMLTLGPEVRPLHPTVILSTVVEGKSAFGPKSLPIEGESVQMGQIRVELWTPAAGAPDGAAAC
ncbi:hypothetical protein, variant [Fonticula alba]|nr:hypothetical protein, variant [Fonticula alba]KCV68771.1 hypothetical protein, variant [Fonticula alba]|eukprot:XP_009497203.1 hypothetical protein, variant [Fonticula alba]